MPTKLSLIYIRGNFTVHFIATILAQECSDHQCRLHQTGLVAPPTVVKCLQGLSCDCNKTVMKPPTLGLDILSLIIGLGLVLLPSRTVT